MAICQDHKQILAAHSIEKNINEWMVYFNNKYTKNQIYSWCHRNNYPIAKISKEEKSKIQSKNARKYYINENFFKTWSNEMAYVLGLWWADGCIYQKKMFDITLHKKDKYILKRIAELLQYKGSLYDYVDRQASRINFSCVTIYNDIIKLGGTECKSLTAEMPIVPQQYLSHFVRGYFDGDGSIWNIKGKRVNSEFCSGSKKFLEQLLQILKEYNIVKGGSIHLANSSYYELTFGNRDTLSLGRWMYIDCNNLFLLRKKERFNF